MIPKRIELENFLSFGKPAVEFSFTDEEPLWALCGQNGIGKSAVFDGITYALYGEHRGGSHKAEQLIRHGANGFRLVFEFEFAGIDYRITRARAGKTTQKVECRIDEVWESVAGVNSAAEVKNWVEKTLALGYKAFTTSVLLRQGEADKLFSASREERIAVLKGIIGFERFEEVSDRVHAATQCRANSFSTLRLQIDSLLPVTTEELAKADEELTSSETTCGLARSNVTAAAQRVEKAKQWESLESKRIILEQALTAAANRAVESATIRSEKARLDELTVAVVELETLVALREGIKALSPKILQAGLTRDQTAGAIELSIQSAVTSRYDEARHKEQSAELNRKSKSLGDEIERGDNLLKLADAMEEIRAKLAAYPSDLADQVSKAEVATEDANQEKQQVSENLAAAQAILKQVKEHQDRFAKVGVGVTCFHCGQLVDKVHARAERERLTTEVQTREAEVERLRLVFAGLNTKSTDARERLEFLKKIKVESDNLSTRLGATRESLTQLGEAATAADLRPRIIDQRKEKTAAEAASAEEKAKQDETKKKADKLELERIQLDKKLKAEEEALRKLEMKLSGDSAAFNLGLMRLTPDWQSRFPMLDIEGVGELASERNRLQADGVNARFESLRQDEEKRDDWTKQLGEVSAEIEGVPSDARVPAKEAERLLLGSKETEKAANDARDATLRSRDELKTRTEQRTLLSNQLRVAERQHDLHKKLDGLLGQNGLQRELVRDAEQQIVALANDTLQNLSGGDLSLEQDDEATGRDDKAFALRVRRAGQALPIGVLFLSGSQKFRVAVSVALAVGRFASGRARPLEAVIIDEGFGSLDKDGLRAMADELKRLQRTQSLKRVVLVSHQDDFTDQFPVGYRLSPGTDGTTATPFRR